ncbi:MAG TPA: hypothetical protein VLY83_01350 [Methanoregula sp.]|nr:hypothetical protein [Methanoregula sp.]
MIGKLKVFTIGADWFYEEMVAQEIDAKPVDWVPPAEVPDDIAGILSSLKG